MDLRNVTLTREMMVSNFYARINITAIKMLGKVCWWADPFSLALPWSVVKAIDTCIMDSTKG